MDSLELVMERTAENMVYAMENVSEILLDASEGEIVSETIVFWPLFYGLALGASLAVLVVSILKRRRRK